MMNWIWRGRPNHKPRIAVTMGDPCGVGPEILVKALSSPGMVEECTPVVIGEPLALQRAMRTLGVPVDAVPWPETVTPLNLTPADICYGKPTRNTCSAVVRYIETAAKMALDGSVDAICTCPIHKAHLHEHGFLFPGHTEFLQNLTRADEVVMMLAGPRLRVSLVTIHHSLADVPRMLSPELVRRTIRLTGDALVRDFGMSSPRIAVAGVNPHAGEGGLFGSEESAVIQPAVESFPKTPFEVSGPHSADTLFHRAYYGEFDAVIAMYHDQGLIPIKLVHFNDAVNVSLGLPIIRTSVDHGTAYNLAGTGMASDGSLQAAIRLASTMVENRRLQR